MRRRKSFEAPTRAEAEALAVGWIHTHPGYRVIESIATDGSTGDSPGVAQNTGGSWVIVLESEETPEHS
jgi:hypothetical protein